MKRLKHTLTRLALLATLSLLAPGARASNPVTSGLALDLEAGVGVYKDAAKTQPCTTAGDAVAVWADQSGGGNDFTQATTASQPAYQPAGLNSLPTVRFNGTSSTLTGPTNSPNFSTGSYTFTWCVSVRAYNNLFYTLLAKASGPGNLRQWYVLAAQNTPGGPAYFDFQRYNGNNGAGVITSAAAAGGGSVTYPTPGYVITYQWDSVAGAETVWVNGQRAAYSQSALPAADTTDPYTLGSVGNGTSYYFLPGDIASVFAYSRVLSATERASEEGYARTQAGIAAFPIYNTSNSVLYTGNSLVQGYASTGGNTFPAQTNLLLGGNYSTYNLGIGGSGTPAWTSLGPAIVDPAVAPGVPNTCVFWEGTNDIAQNNASGATAYANIVTYCKARRAAGYQVVVLSVLPRNSTTGTYNTPALFETQRQACNTLLRANWQTFASGFVDVGNDPAIGQAGQYTNTTYYSGDGIHLTNAGYGVVAADAAPVIKALTAGGGGGTKRRLQ